jgi:hypothetical protein
VQASAALVATRIGDDADEATTFSLVRAVRYNLEQQFQRSIGSKSHRMQRLQLDDAAAIERGGDEITHDHDAYRRGVLPNAGPTAMRAAVRGVQLEIEHRAIALAVADTAKPVPVKSAARGGEPVHITELRRGIPSPTHGSAPGRS